MDISGNTVFIPGATSGIGLALATRFQARGNTVIVGGRREDRLRALESEHGFSTVRVDTSDPAGIRAAAAEVLAAHPALNVLVPMAGIQEPEDWSSADVLDVVERTVATNYLGPLRLVAAFVEHLRRQPAATIMTVSSGLAFVPFQPTPAYTGTKAAIHLFSESLRLQLADTSVQVIELVPPAVRTALMNQQDAEHAMPLDQFADEAFDLIEKDPDAHEILVDTVRYLRDAEKRGDYDTVVAALNGLGA